MSGRGAPVGTRRSLEVRIKMLAAANINNGMPPGWADEALDFYLAGETVPEIKRVYSCSSKQILQWE